MINKIIKFTKKKLVAFKITNELSKKKNWNNSEIVNRKNTHNIRAEKRQSCHNDEYKRDRSLGSCFAHSIFSQFKEKKIFKLNNSINKKLFKKTKTINNFQKKNKRNKQRKRRDFAEILCVVNIVFISQREFPENMRTIKKNNFHKICKRRECINVLLRDNFTTFILVWRYALIKSFIDHVRQDAFVLYLHLHS